MTLEIITLTRILSISLLFITWTKLAESFDADEMECPDQLNINIFNDDYWVEPGVEYRAWRTLPWKMFSIRQSNIPGAGLGIFSRTFIPRNTWLGEYEGEMLNLEQVGKVKDFSYAWRVITEGDVTHYVDARRETTSNWLRFINCPVHTNRENIADHACFGRIHHRTKLDLAPGQELYIYYGDSYAKNNLKIDLDYYYDLSFH